MTQETNSSPTKDFNERIDSALELMGRRGTATQEDILLAAFCIADNLGADDREVLATTVAQRIDTVYDEDHDWRGEDQ